MVEANSSYIARQVKPKIRWALTWLCGRIRLLWEETHCSQSNDS